MAPLSFWKMSGSGNDFILVDNRRGAVPAGEGAALARRLCARGFSVGADGLILIERSREADFAWRFHNADGSEAAMCGNGGRCAARFAFLRKIAPARMRFLTGAGLIRAEVRGERVKLELPPPAGYREAVPVEIAGNPVEAGFIVVGVPHAVLHAESLESVPVAEWGRPLRHHAAFGPAGANVNFFRVEGPHALRVRTYERGVEGETHACGTGSVATVLVAAAAGLVSSPVTVTTSGGEKLRVYFRRRAGEFAEVFLEGRADVVYEGRLWEAPAAPARAKRRGREGR
ncbi:MAG TPA: diaminopimelate epimerase [bacterium]